MKQNGHMGFSAEHAKELKISNRTIKIDVQNDETILAADSKLFDELEVVWWKEGVDSPRVRRDDEQTA